MKEFAADIISPRTRELEMTFADPQQEVTNMFTNEHEGDLKMKKGASAIHWSMISKRGMEKQTEKF